ncbi:MAG: serine/threonine-protein kinase [Myxococcota bacterium]
MSTTNPHEPFGVPPEDLAARRLRADRAKALFGENGPDPMKIGRFTLTRQLGRGGQGSVFVAHDDELDRSVALKRLHSFDANKGRDLREEAKTLARFKHPNVVTVHEVGLDPIDGPFIVMELVEGKPLGDWLEEKPRHWTEIVRVLIQLARGLAALHEQRVIHRDVKPPNVVIESTGRVKLVDLGIAFLAPDPTTEVGAETDFEARSRGWGTTGYMAPEQVAGERLDPRTDQYSFFVVAYEALYGARPPLAVSSELGRQRGDGRSNGGSKPRTRVPRSLRRILERGLAKDPSHRFEDMATVAAQLEDLVRRRRMIPSAAVAAGALLVTAGVVATLWPGAESACARGETGASLWSPQRRNEVRHSFVATGSSSAESTFSAVDAVLTRYTVELDTAHESACTALSQREEEPAEAHARLACIARAQGVVTDMVEQLGTITAEELPGAPENLASLPEFASCTRVAGPEQTCDPGRAVPGFADAVRAIGLKLQAAEARIMLGRYAEGMELAEAAIALAEPGPLTRLRGQAWLVHGRLAYESQQFDIALRSLEEASSLAEQQACDGIAAESLALMAKVRALQPKGDAEEALRWSQQALDKLERLGDVGPRRADALNSRGLVLHQRLQRYEEADVLYREAARLREQFLPTTALALSDTLLNRGAVLAALGDLDQAVEVLEDALSIREEALGSDHPGLYKLHLNLGNRRLERGQTAEAEASFQRGLELAKLGFGSQHHKIAALHLNLAAALDHRGAFDLALEHASEAIAIYDDALEADDLRRIDAWGAMAQVLIDASRPVDAVPWATKTWELVRQHPQATAMERTLGAYRLGSTHRQSPSPEAALVWFDRALELSNERAPEPAQVPKQIDELRAHVHLERGEVLLSLERAREAVASLAAAERWWAAQGSNPERLAHARWGLGQALVMEGSSPTARGRADELTRSALSYFEKGGDERWMLRVRQWRTDHGLE